MKKKISDYTTAIYCCRFAINNLLCVEYIKKYRPKKKRVDCLPGTKSMLQKCCVSFVLSPPHSSTIINIAPKKHDFS